MQHDLERARLVAAELAGSGEPVLTKAILEAGLAETVVAELVDLHTPESGQREEGVDKVMVMLEHFASRYPYEGCLLMVTLYPPAGHLYMHDVCDAVDLCIEALHPAGLESQLRGFAADPSNRPEMRKKYLEWADCIAESASKNQPDQN